MPRAVLVILACLLAVAARAAEVQIRGLRSMPEQEAVDMLSSRLEYLKTRPASTSRADDAAFLLERLLVQNGFTDPRVDWSLPGGNRIVLEVAEGPRSTLGNIYIRGVDAELLEALQAQVRSAHKARVFNLFGEETPFLVENNEEAVRDAGSLLKSMGYWRGEVRLARTAHRPGSTDVDIFIEADPGPLHHLLPIQFEGTVDPAIVARLQEFTGRVATTDNIRNARARVELFYRKRGHQFAVIKMLADHRAGRTQLRIIVAPGPRYRVGEIEVVDYEKVKPEHVRERFRDFRGRPYDSEAFNREIRDLLGTGAFAGIRLEESPRPDGYIDLTLHVTESKPEGYYFYGGAGSFEGPILGAGYFNRNLFGKLWNFSTRAEWSGIGLLGEASVTEPRFLGYDLRFTATAFLTTRTYEGYKKAEGGLDTDLRWDFGEHYTLEASFRNSLVAVSPDGLPRSEIGPDGYFLHVLGLSQIYDRRDNVALPEDGFYAKLDTGLGLALGAESVSFVRAEAQVSYYKSIFDKGAVAVGGRAGVIVPNGSDASLPVDLRYFLGGSNSVRSFPERELGPEANNGIPRGGESYWVANAEYIHTIAGPLNAVLFLDAGSLSRDHNELFAGDIKYALGLGLRLDLPIGPVRLEYGHALNPEGSDPSGAFHFAIGTAF